MMMAASYLTARLMPSGPHPPADQLPEPVEVERLLEARVGDAIEEHAHVRQEQAARDEHDARGLIGRELRDPVSQFDPVDARHHHVAEDDGEQLARGDTL